MRGLTPILLVSISIRMRKITNAYRYVRFLCLIHKDEPEHSDAVQAYANTTLLITHSYVLEEFVSLAHARKFPRDRSLQFSRQILSEQQIELLWVDKALHDSALRLLEHRMDKTYSLCDAVSFVIMRERGITDALTTDKHFEQEGFVRLLKWSATTWKTTSYSESCVISRKPRQIEKVGLPICLEMR